MDAGKGFGLAALLLTVAVPATAQPQEGHAGSVRLYDMAGLDAATTQTALSTADAVLRSASIAVQWEECGTDAPTRCDVPLAGQYVVRIVRTGDDNGRPPLALGDALVDTTTGSAVFATIYFQRVHRLAQSAGANEGEVLGYALAHELGHLLLASHAHSAQGVMRPIWRERELRVYRDADWQFSAQDAASIRDRVEAARVSSNIVWTTR